MPCKMIVFLKRWPSRYVGPKNVHVICHVCMNNKRGFVLFRYTTRSAYYMALNFCWLKTFVVFKSITFWKFFEVLRMVTSVFIMMWKLTKLTQFVSLSNMYFIKFIEKVGFDLQEDFQKWYFWQQQKVVYL